MKREQVVPLPWRLSSVLCAAAGLWLAAGARAADDHWASAPAVAGGKIVVQVASAENEDPAAAGRAAAQSLKKAMGETPLKAVVISECYEGRSAKEKLLAGIAAVLPKEILLGSATYGSFTQAGCTDADAVCLLGIGGDGLAVSAALVTGLGTARLTFQDSRALIESRLQEAGAKLAQKLRRSDQDQLLVLLADAHSPKNQSLVEGVQKVFGPKFPITGGCANKNAGQTFVYFAGQAYEDSAVALVLSGKFAIALAGRQAKDNETVIRTAEEVAAEAAAKSQGQKVIALGFNCAGRRSKLKRIEDELTAIQKALGKDVPLFGCYCAGEMGPVDGPDKKPGVTSGGAGWHLMFTVIGR